MRWARRPAGPVAVVASLACAAAWSTLHCLPAGVPTAWAGPAPCSWLQEGKLSQGARLTAGLGAGVSEALLIVTPFEVVKTRLQQQKGTDKALLKYRVSGGLAAGRAMGAARHMDRCGRPAASQMPAVPGCLVLLLTVAGPAAAPALPACRALCTRQ